MAHFTITRRMPFRAGDLFAIAADVRSYPQFVPLCTGARVWDERTDVDGRQHFRAAIDISYAKLRLSETLYSEVSADPAALSLRAVSDRAPVRHLENRWLFHDLAHGGTEIDFFVAYEMASRPLQFVLSGMFDYAARKIINAFEHRASMLHEPVR